MQQIKLFSQKDQEPFFEVWERSKDLLLSCTHHRFEKWPTISFFYEGLNPKSKKLVETMCQGEFFSKNADEAESYF